MDMVVSLDQQMYPAIKPIIDDYAKKNAIKILVKDGTCGISAGMLAKKSVDVGGFCCPPGSIQLRSQDENSDITN